MGRLAIIDYGAGNLDSVARAVERCGAAAVVVSDPAGLHGAHGLILPGVGSFAEGMGNLRRSGLASAIQDRVAQGAPLLGICLGMQLLASSGEEGGVTEGLGLIPAHVRRLVPGPGERLPHVGWNRVDWEGGAALARGLPPEADFYFVHSYALVCGEPGDAIATTPYCGGFTSAVRRGNVLGVQFHPEKSQRAGRQLLSNFLGLLEGAAC